MLLLTETQKQTLFKNYEVQELIGEGPLSEVYRAVVRSDGSVVAIKLMDKRILVRNRKVKAIYREKDAYIRLAGCPNVVQLRETMQDEDTVYFVMDFVPYGDLRSYVLEHEVSEDTARNIVKGIYAALQCIHIHGYAHR